MKWENFTAERVASFRCKPNKQQCIYWDGKTPGLGLRVTTSNSKSYIFESTVNGKTIRMTIGKSLTWTISKAQAEATKYKALIDQGINPRKVKVDSQLAKELKARESTTLSTAWCEYLAARKEFWGERHYVDHINVIHLGGSARARSHKLTEPGVLSSLAAVRLIDLTAERVTEWAKVEGGKRAGRARLAARLLKAFLTWCSEHPAYRNIVVGNAVKNKSTRELLGKPKLLDDVLQREQLSSWFCAVKKLDNNIISSYLQALLLTGSRPNELTAIRWKDVDFRWNSLTIKDKVEGERVIPLTPYLSELLAALPRCNDFVFSSPTAASGHLIDPHSAHNKACVAAGLTMTLYGLRRSFATLSEWIETPSGIAAQIQGHKPSGVREKHYIRRPLDLLRKWHIQIEAWILKQANIDFVPQASRV